MVSQAHVWTLIHTYRCFPSMTFVCIITCPRIMGWLQHVYQYSRNIQLFAYQSNMAHFFHTLAIICQWFTKQTPAKLRFNTSFMMVVGWAIWRHIVWQLAWQFTNTITKPMWKQSFACITPTDYWKSKYSHSPCTHEYRAFGHNSNHSDVLPI